MIRIIYAVIIILLCIGFSYAARLGNCTSCHNVNTYFKSTEAAVSALVKGGIKQAPPAKRKQLTPVLTPIDPVFLPISEENIKIKSDIYAVVPIDEKQYRKVFSKSPNHQMSENEKKEIEESRLAIAFTYRQKTHFASANENENSIKKFIRNSKSNNIVIYGHNEEGIFKLPNGQVSLKLLDEFCVKENKICFFLSCNSDRWVSMNPSVNKSLTLVEASELAFKLDRYLIMSETYHWSKDKLNKMLNEFVLDAKRETRKEVVLKNIGPALSLITVVGAYGMTSIILGDDTNQGEP